MAMNTKSIYTMHPHTRPRVAAVDLDGTLAKSLPWEESNRMVGDMVSPRVPNFIANLRRGGYRVIIYTSRPVGHEPMIAQWLAKNKILVDGIVCGKLKADLYVDTISMVPHFGKE